MGDLREEFTRNYLHEIRETLDLMEDDLVERINHFTTLLFQAREQNKTIFIMGNGGSAATASHFACDLSKLTIVEGSKRFKTHALTDNIPNLLAWANDEGYDKIFIEQLKSLMQPGDIVIGISSSGNSMNVINAIEYANTNGGISFALSGCDGGKLLHSAQESIHIPSSNMQQVEDIHLAIIHLVTSLIREEDMQMMTTSIPEEG